MFDLDNGNAAASTFNPPYGADPALARDPRPLGGFFGMMAAAGNTYNQTPGRGRAGSDDL